MIYDTLAAALFSDGKVDEAIATQAKILKDAPAEHKADFQARYNAYQSFARGATPEEPEEPPPPPVAVRPPPKEPPPVEIVGLEIRDPVEIDRVLRPKFEPLDIERLGPCRYRAIASSFRIPTVVTGSDGRKYSFLTHHVLNPTMKGNVLSFCLTLCTMFEENLTIFSWWGAENIECSIRTSTERRRVQKLIDSHRLGIAIDFNVASLRANPNFTMMSLGLADYQVTYYELPR